MSAITSKKQLHYIQSLLKKKKFFFFLNGVIIENLSQQ